MPHRSAYHNLNDNPPYPANARPRPPAGAAWRRADGFTFTHAGRQIRLGPIAFWVVVGTLVIMAALSVTTATYFAFREDVLTRLVRREAEMGMRLDGPAILPVQAYGESDEALYLVMPLIDGASLAEVIARRRQLSSGQLANLGSWWEDLSEVKDFAGLPRNAQNYVRALEQMIGAQVAAIGTGPRRDQTLQLRPLLGR